jgi:hypothetical protein
VPLLLCCVDGQTQDAAARRLGWSAGSVKGRLERARELLRCRLTRRGVCLSVSALTSALADTAAAEIPDRLAVTTVGSGLRYAAGETAMGSAAVLAQAVLRTSAICRIQLVAALLLAVSILGGGAAWFFSKPSTPPHKSSEMAADDGRKLTGETPRPRQDSYGDALPAAALARLGTVRWRPGQQTNGLAVSADSKLIAVANEGGLSLWDTDTGKQLGLLGPAQRLDEAMFLPGGGTLASRWGTVVSFWDIKTGKLLRQFEPKPVDEERFINGSILSADGRVFVGITDKDQAYYLNI